MTIHWGSFVLGVVCTLACMPIATFLWWLYNWCCTDWDTGAFVPPRWLRRLRGGSV